MDIPLEKILNYNKKDTVSKVTKTAIYLDDKITEVWTGHNNFRIIDSYPYFQDKINNLIKEISYILHEESNSYVDKKYLIKMPNIENLNKLKYCRKIKIKQHYLIDKSQKEEIKIVLREENYKNFYYKVTKNLKGKFTKSLTADEYINELENDNKNFYHIYKNRYFSIFE